MGIPNFMSNTGVIGKVKGGVDMFKGAVGNKVSTAGVEGASNDARNSTGETLDANGQKDVNDTAQALTNGVQDAAAMTKMNMQASSAMAAMNMMASVNDGLNSVMKKAGESFKSAAQ
ncbi:MULTISPECIES: hypothetical protein [unclassified Rhizobacter]|uniref:hypothetical protein n=1 Tax=unclassified Rhizobacter TaxID=2640088 RepID=UPI0006F2F2C6|nr:MULTISPECIES: hypothetical protein [unclassified Rhizobacter]KQU80546.1 hypothetical protein ASC88_13235 [Rhizobacter sp. Root29]KQW03499.1 hypothetical protein ASC98_27425 [Rhizobacter sp. Root1238]KRB15923.1 hypothetical protein ASE08_26530 [Rhizobacter sp. Root16D2]